MNNLKAERTLTAEDRVSDERLAHMLALAEDGTYLDPVDAVSALRELQHLRSQPLSTQQPMGEATKALDIADTCDGVEQYAFEAWAASAKYDMEEHPLHYIFMHPKTDAARMGWRAGIEHARKRLLLSALHPNQGSGE